MEFMGRTCMRHLLREKLLGGDSRGNNFLILFKKDGLQGQVASLARRFSSGELCTVFPQFVGHRVCSSLNQKRQNQR